jgi:dipeptidyl aminopeptidase/acylaminoacyl peptidase
MARQIRHGEWPSPLSARAVVADRMTFPNVGFGADGSAWWGETRPGERGRTAVMRWVAPGTAVQITPAGWGARTRVHEYGGTPWCLAGDRLVISDGRDGRLYLCGEPGSGPVPLTAAPVTPHADRYGDMTALPDGSGVLAVRERHGTGGVRRDLVVVPLDGSAGDGAPLRTVWRGSDFIAAPRLSPGGTRLAFLTWDHPAMPWDSSQLRVLELPEPLTAAGPSTAPPQASEPRASEQPASGQPASEFPASEQPPFEHLAAAVLAGGTAESVVQPVWLPDGRLLALSDRSGWWNPYEVTPAGLRPLCPAAEEFAEPPWLLGMATWAPLDSHRIAVRHGTDPNRLGVLDLDRSELTDVDLPLADLAPVLAASGDRILVAGRTADGRGVVVLADLGTGEAVELRSDVDPATGVEHLPTPRRVQVPAAGDRSVPVRLYPPASPDAVGLPGERPPWVITVHGGPTSRSLSSPRDAAFFTSRGIGVVDVDYGGSSGWGRAWRQALYGRWGILDVDDCAAAARWLIDEGLADAGRIAIRGGSAGGWTSLCAVTRSPVFGAAVSVCGVVDAELLAAHTHDFESHYLDWLIGPLPRDRDEYRARSPLSNVDAIAVPVLVVQGLDDPVVPRAQAESMVAALHANGVPYAYLGFAGEQHGLREGENRVAAIEAELSFYGQVFGFQPPDTPPLAITYPNGRAEAD